MEADLASQARVKTELARVKTELARVKTELARVKTELARVKTKLANQKIRYKAESDKQNARYKDLKQKYDCLEEELSLMDQGNLWTNFWTMHKAADCLLASVNDAGALKSESGTLTPAQTSNTKTNSNLPCFLSYSSLYLFCKTEQTAGKKT